MIESEVDLCITCTDYSQDFPLEGLNDYDSTTSVVLDDDDPHGTRPILPTPGKLINTLPQYHSIEGLNYSLSKLSDNDFFALHLNAVSLVSNFDEIHSFISAKCATSPDILCLSETRFKDEKIEAQTQLTSITGYNLAYDNSKTSAHMILP